MKCSYLLGDVDMLLLSVQFTL